MSLPPDFQSNSSSTYLLQSRHNIKTTRKHLSGWFLTHKGNQAWGNKEFWCQTYMSTHQRPLKGPLLIILFQRCHVDGWIDLSQWSCEDRLMIFHVRLAVPWQFCVETWRIALRANDDAAPMQLEVTIESCVRTKSIHPSIPGSHISHQAVAPWPYDQWASLELSKALMLKK